MKYGLILIENFDRFDALKQFQEAADKFLQDTIFTVRVVRLLDDNLYMLVSWTGSPPSEVIQEMTKEEMNAYLADNLNTQVTYIIEYDDNEIINIYETQTSSI